jgi:hypothetical protein
MRSISCKKKISFKLKSVVHMLIQSDGVLTFTWQVCYSLPPVNLRKLTLCYKKKTPCIFLRGLIVRVYYDKRKKNVSDKNYLIKTIRGIKVQYKPPVNIRSMITLLFFLFCIYKTVIYRSMHLSIRLPQRNVITITKPKNRIKRILCGKRPQSETHVGAGYSCYQINCSAQV